MKKHMTEINQKDMKQILTPFWLAYHIFEENDLSLKLSSWRWLHSCPCEASLFVQLCVYLFIYFWTALQPCALSCNKPAAWRAIFSNYSYLNLAVIRTICIILHVQKSKIYACIFLSSLHESGFFGNDFYLFIYLFSCTQFNYTDSKNK